MTTTTRPIAPTTVQKLQMTQVLHPEVETTVIEAARSLGISSSLGFLNLALARHPEVQAAASDLRPENFARFLNRTNARRLIKAAAAF